LEFRRVLFRSWGNIPPPWLIAFGQCEGSGLSPSPQLGQGIHNSDEPVWSLTSPFFKGGWRGISRRQLGVRPLEIPPSPPLRKGGEIFLPWLIAFAQSESSSPLP